MNLNSKEKMARLRAALLEQKTNSAHALAHDLDQCGIEWNGRYSCRSPICPHCRATNVRAQQRGARSFVADADNSELALMTVVLNGTRHVDEIGEIITKGYRATRNRINTSRRTLARWNTLGIKGWYEIDAFGADHVPLLGSDRMALLSEIAHCHVDQTEPMWVPTYHAIVKLGSVGLHEVREAFMHQWSLPNQVHIERFELDQPVGDNIDRIASYANKHVCTIQLGHAYEPWPISWTASLYSWLHQHRNAFEFLRFSVKEKVLTAVNDHAVCPVTEHEPLPFAYSSNTFPMSYYW